MASVKRDELFNGCLISPYSGTSGFCEKVTIILHSLSSERMSFGPLDGDAELGQGYHCGFKNLKFSISHGKLY